MLCSENSSCACISLMYKSSTSCCDIPALRDGPTRCDSGAFLRVYPVLFLHSLRQNNGKRYDKTKLYTLTRDFFRTFGIEVASRMKCSGRRLHTHRGSSIIIHKFHVILPLAERLNSPINNPSVYLRKQMVHMPRLEIWEWGLKIFCGMPTLTTHVDHLLFTYHKQTITEQQTLHTLSSTEKMAELV